MTGVLWHSSGISIIPRETDIDWDEWESQSGLGLEPPGGERVHSGQLEQFQGQVDTTTEPVTPAPAATEPPVTDPSSSTLSLSTIPPTDSTGSTTVMPTVSESPATTTNPGTAPTDSTTPTSAETETGSPAMTGTTDPGNPTTPGTIQTDATSPTSPQTTTLPGSITTITDTESSAAPTTTEAGPISSEAPPSTSTPGSTSTSSSLSSESPAPPFTPTATDSSTVTPEITASSPTTSASGGSSIATTSTTTSSSTASSPTAPSISTSTTTTTSASIASPSTSTETPTVSTSPTTQSASSTSSSTLAPSSSTPTPTTSSSTSALTSSTSTPAAASTTTTNTEAPTQESTTTSPSTPTLTSTPAPAICKCGAGIPRLSNLSKIVGGVSARNHAWPWMAIIVTGNGALCGGSLINNLYVLTAAHCVDRLDSSDIGSSAVILGRNRVIPNTTSRAIRRIASVGGISVHPLYNISGFAPYNDIALIKLSSPVVFSDFIKPICLGQSGAPFTGRQALVTGWGKVNESSTHSNSLREAKVTVISNEECNATYPYIIRHTHVCAYRPPHDACNGDSGGPLIVLKDKNPSSTSTSTPETPDPDDGIEYFTQIGIVSFGRGCGQVGSPGVYTRVEKFLNWIRAKTRGSGATYCGDSFA